MRLNDIICEKLDSKVEFPNGKVIRVYKDSSLSEFRTLLTDWEEMRGFMDNKHFYIFPALHSTHPEMADALGLELKKLFLWEIVDNPSDEIRNISRTSTNTNFSHKDDYDMYEFMLNHPTFEKIANSRMFDFFDSHIEVE